MTFVTIRTCIFCTQGGEEREVIEIVEDIYDYIFKYIIIIISNTACEEGEKKYVVFCHNCHTPIFFRTFAPRMEKIRFDVVGLYHWDVRDHWKEYAAEAVGKTLTLQPQPENVKDPYAVRAREGAVHVGYVAVTDLDVVYQALKGCGKERLKGVVVRSNTEPPVLTVECEVERVDWDYEPFDDSVYAGWHYDGLSLMPRKMEQLQDLVDDIIDDLDPNMDSHRSDSTGENLRSLVETLLDTHLYDMSREMTRARYRVERLLSDRETSFLSEQLDQLRLQKGMLMCHEYRDRVARYLFLELPRELRRKGLEDSHYTYDNRLDELKSQLSSFPYQLYDKFLCDPVDFLREVYYHHVPRKYLFQLLSGIILMILKGQVQIQRWGREGDMEPIEEIKALCKRNITNKLSNDDILISERAKKYWKKLQEKEFVDKDHKLLPTTTRQQAMLIADNFSMTLKLKAKWKPFERLWGINNLAQEKWAHLETGNEISRAEEIEETFFS